MSSRRQDRALRAYRLAAAYEHADAPHRWFESFGDILRSI